jgi:hypothetical protein
VASLARQRFLDALDSPLCHGADLVDRFFEPPDAVGVDAERYVRPERFAHSSHPGETSLVTYLDLAIA